MPVPQRYSLITLGVADVEAATAFYRALGWRESSASVAGEVAFFATPGGVLGLWSADKLAADAGAPAVAPSGFRGIALAINLASRDDVDTAIEAWVAAGGTVTRDPAATDWGGYSGYVADPDGHTWELAHNPFWPLDDRGLPTLPEPDGE
jgi:predicted lactoylglutathione lyase